MTLLPPHILDETSRRHLTKVFQMMSLLLTVGWKLQFD